MNQTITTPILSLQRHQPFKPSNEIIGFEKATGLLVIGCGCIFLVFIFGFILCRLDMSAGKKRRIGVLYIEK